MVFQLSNTFNQPTDGSGPQRGFPAPGAGAQSSGDAVAQPQADTPWYPKRAIKGMFTWLLSTSSASGQRGFPPPDDASQRRPPGSMPNKPPVFGGVYQKYTPYYDRGAAAFVPNFGKVLVNPIGAGIPALQRPQASYGSSAQFVNGAIWWSNQEIPTSVNLTALSSPEELAALLGTLQVQAVVRVDPPKG